ncbi:MAG TPA: hypothetical protein VFO07_12825, partial [Roseiflexaceae bacterium]|nr:hypothetical protein [Roseiflexaceae bacterium]
MAIPEWSIESAPAGTQRLTAHEYRIAMAIAELPPSVAAPTVEVDRSVGRSPRGGLTIEHCAYLGLFVL